MLSRLPMHRAWSAFAVTLVALLFVACGTLGTDLPGSIERALEEAPRGTTPLFLDEGVTLVPVFLDSEGPLMFVLDTGASMTLLSPSTRDRLGYGEQDGDSARLTGATGHGYYQRLQLDSLTVGSHTVNDFEVAVVNLDIFQQSGVRYAGVLGQDYLQHFDFAYDLPNSELRLYPHRADSAPPIAGLDTLKQVPLKETDYGSGFIAFDLSVGGEPAEGIFDTGSRFTILNWRAAQQDGTEAEPGTGTGEIVGIGSGDPTLAQDYTFGEIRAGELSFAPREVSIADLPVFRTLGLQHRSAVIIGNDMVEDRLVVVSYSTKTIYFSSARTD